MAGWQNKTQMPCPDSGMQKESGWGGKRGRKRPCPKSRLGGKTKRRCPAQTQACRRRAAGAAKGEKEALPKVKAGWQNKTQMPCPDSGMQKESGWGGKRGERGPAQSQGWVAKQNADALPRLRHAEGERLGRQKGRKRPRPDAWLGGKTRSRCSAQTQACRRRATGATKGEERGPAQVHGWLAEQKCPKGVWL